MDWAAIGAFWETWSTPLTVVLVIAGAVAVNWLLRLGIRRIVHRVVTGVKRRSRVDDTQSLQASPLAAVRVVQRTRALGGLLNSSVSAIVVIVTLLVLISILLPNATGAFAVLSAAVGAGLGFGAQNIVKDVLNGLFMVSEDQLGVGDVVDLGPATGVVEQVGIRITQVRDVHGTLWSVRNGEIVRVGNMSQGWARVIIDLAVPYDVDTDDAQRQILDTAIAMAESPKWRSVVLEKPEVWGIESIAAEAIVIRLVVKTRTSSKDDVARELRARLKVALDTAGIRLPALNSLVLSGTERTRAARRPTSKTTSTATSTPTSTPEEP